MFPLTTYSTTTAVTVRELCYLYLFIYQRRWALLSLEIMRI